MSRSDAEKADFLRRMIEYIPHAGELGMRVERVAGNELTLRLPWREDLVGNPETGAIHGGVITTLMDQALGTAGLVHDDVPPNITPTLDLRIDHLRQSPRGADMFATARVYRATSRVLFVQGLAYCESPDKPVARATGSFVLRGEIDLQRILSPEET